MLSPIPPEGSLTHVENLRISSSYGSVLFHNAINIDVIGLARFVEMIGPFMAKLIHFESEGGIVTTEMEYAICSPVTVTHNSSILLGQIDVFGLEVFKVHLPKKCSNFGLTVIPNSIGVNELVGHAYWQLGKFLYSTMLLFIEASSYFIVESLYQSAEALHVQSPGAALESGQPTSTTLTKQSTEHSGAPPASVPSGDYS